MSEPDQSHPDWIGWYLDSKAWMIYRMVLLDRAEYMGIKIIPTHETVDLPFRCLFCEAPRMDIAILLYGHPVCMRCRDYQFKQENLRRSRQ